MTSEETVKSIDETEYTLSDLPQYLLDTIQSNDKEVESLDLENINDEHSITTNNKDGSKTNYKFDIPIKYKNQNKILFKNPKIKKSNKLKEKAKKYNYESVENNFKTYFPQKLKDGILMEYENYKIEVSSINKIEYPLNEMTANEKDNIIKYSNIFSLDDYIEYIPTLNGLKENIVLNKYSGENTF